MYIFLSNTFIEWLNGNWIWLTIVGGVLLWFLASILLYRFFFKRLYDIIFSCIGMPFFFLIFVPISLAIKLSKKEDRGPILYCGKRAGKKGKLFGMKKFRSMKVNSPDIRLKDGATFAGKNDPRVTKVGKFLRATSLDETPQIIDIFLGNMSFIGPRPDVPDVVEKLQGTDRDLLKMRPGLTGYTQAKYRNNIIYAEKIKKDCWYANNVSFFLDVKIFFMTIWMVLRRKNLHNEETGEIDETTLGELLTGEQLSSDPQPTTHDEQPLFEQEITSEKIYDRNEDSNESE